MGNNKDVELNQQSTLYVDVRFRTYVFFNNLVTIHIPSPICGFAIKKSVK
jgi:hypothetical protein